MTNPPPAPAELARLPRDRHNRLIPWFVSTDEHGVPDHRVARMEAMRDAIRFDLCWLCGGRRGRYGTFVVGPMCGITRISSEPPSHAPCAEHAAQACPFLITPTMRRRERDLPKDKIAPAGTMIPRNPGVALLWTTRDWRVLRQDNGFLFDLGDPTGTRWFHRGRDASRAEVLESIETGIPSLLTDAEQHGRRAVDDLAARRVALLPWLPPDRAIS